MSGYYNNANYFGSAGVATNASYVGPWIAIDDVSSIGVKVYLTGTSSPVATWGADVTDDPDAPKKADANILPGITALTLTDDMTDQNPVGDAANINFLFQFDPAPRAKWFRFKYTRASGGSASLLLKDSINTWGARA